MEVFRHEVLRAARLELGLTQEEIACSLGIDIRTYRRYEAGSVNDPDKGFSVRRAGRRQLLARIGEELGIAADELVGPVERGGPATVVGHVLPPARQFVGRVRELERLQSWCASSDAPQVLCLVGVGGAGKSSLVQQWLETREDTPLVWSFYDDARVEGFVAAALGEATLNTTAAVERLLSATPQGRVWVLDGFEVMQADGSARPRGAIKDPLLRRLLTTLAARPGGTRVLITTRIPLLDLEPWEGRGARTLTLSGLPAVEQRALLRAWGVRAPDAELDRVLERFGGHALSVATLGSLVMGAYGGDLSLLGPLDLHDAREDDPLAHRLAGLLDAYADALTDAQADLLARVAVFPQGVGIETLCDLAEDASLRGSMPQTRRTLVQTLSRLEARGLVHRSHAASSRFGVHPALGSHFRERLGVGATAIHDVRRRQLQARLHDPPRAMPRDDQLDLLEELLTHTRLAGHAGEAFALYRRGLGGFDGLGLERGDMARGARVLRGFLHDDDPALPMPGLARWQVQAVLYEQALFGCALGDPSFALACLERFVALTEAEPRMHTTGLRTTAYVLRLMGRFDDALSFVRRALSAAPGEDDHRVRNLALEGAVHHDCGAFDDAGRCFAEARTLDPQPRFRRALWEAEHRLECGDIEGASQLAEATRRACEVRGWPGHVSHADVVVGRCAAARDPDVADRAHTEALRWAERSGEVEARLRCYELQLLLVGDPAREQLRRDAQSLANSASFGRFTGRFL